MTLADDRDPLAPLLTPESRRLWDTLLQHEDAPLWNARVGDRVIRSDLDAVDGFRQRIAAPRIDIAAEVPPSEILAAVEHARREAPLLRDRIAADLDLAADWARVPTTSREDLAARPELLVPDDADLSRLIVHSTSGTTGHAVRIPMSPRFLALNHAMLERVLSRNGVAFAPGPDGVAVTHLCARRDTFIFPTVFAVWGGAGFVKENLDERAWPGGRAAARRFAAAWPAPVASGDPVAFAEALAWELPLATKAFVSTTYRIDAPLAMRLETTYGARVIDWYSLTETGPIAASMPGAPGLEVIAHDLFVEAIGEDGKPAPDGTPGEIAVTGGRNPYFPLVRYRTGDRGRVIRARCADGTAVTRILDLDGRPPAVYRDEDGRPVASVDLTRALRAASVFAHHAIEQDAGGAVTVRVRPVPGERVRTEALADAVHRVLGRTVEASIVVDPAA